VSDLTTAIETIYAEVAAPEWAAPNLDGLADILRDLSWRPPGPVAISVPPLNRRDRRRLAAVLAWVVEETATSARPVVLDAPD
jgi:hypothetical protein